MTNDQIERELEKLMEIACLTHEPTEALKKHNDLFEQYLLNKQRDKTYLGEGKYVSYDGEYIILTYENSHKVLQKIYLEKYIFEALQDFVKQEVQSER